MRCPSAAGAGAQPRSDNLGFVDTPKEDISELLDGSSRSKDDPLVRLLRDGVLCYSRPAEHEEDRWREARALGGLDVPQQGPSASHPSRSSGATAPSAGDRAQGARAAGSRPPALAFFGSPPHSSQLRWPPRPRVADVLGEGAATDVGEPEDSGDSDGSEPVTRRRAGANAAGAEEEKDLSDSGESDASETGRRRQSSLFPSADPVNETVSELGQSLPSSLPGPARPSALDAGELLEFTSCFESGNLRYAVYNAQDNAYDLILENDVHTRGHTQWFYFAVRNGRPGETVLLRIVNMSKAKSLFRLGMRPVAWSEARAWQLSSEVVAAQKASGLSGASRPCAQEERLWDGAASQLWSPAGERVRYHQTHLRHGPASTGSSTLSWEYTFGPKEGDCVFFAMAVPFTYSMLRSGLAAITHDPKAKSWCRSKRLCGTLGGVKCDLLEISNWSVSKRQKKTVVVSSRVHPGESNASWIVHGLIGFLLSPGPEAQVLRDHFVWQIVPMMNPDGVVCGNYRCGLSGVDLNRQWRHPSESLHSSVHGLKRLIQRSKRRQGCCMYIDLHGHSRKCGLFSYACAQYPKDDYRRFTVRMYPKLLSMLTPEFTPGNCRWRVGKGKRGTGRAVVTKDLGLAETYTIEASFFGAALAPPRESRGDAELREVGQMPRNSSKLMASSSFEAEQPGQVTVLFTPAKLELFGANLARAVLLHQNLHPQLKQATERRNGIESAPWPDVRPCRGPAVESPPGSGTTTPSAASEGDRSAGTEDAPSEAESAPGDAEDLGELAEASVSAEPNLAALLVPPSAPGAPSAPRRPPGLFAHRGVPTLSSEDLECEVRHEVPWPTPVAGGPAEPYLGIDPSLVMQELQDAPLSSTEAESNNGSDSEPSQDNLDREELARIGHMLKVKRPWKGRGGGSRASATKKRWSSEGRGAADKQRPPKSAAWRQKEKAAEAGGAPRGRRSVAAVRGLRGASPAEAGVDRLAITGAGVGGGSFGTTRSRQDLQKNVAFGQTTYLRTDAEGRGSADPAAAFDVYSDTSSLNLRRPPARLGSTETQLGATAACVLLRQQQRGENWPPISRASLERREPQQALLLWGAPKDRFSFHRGASGASSVDATRRRVCVRNVSGSLLQPRRFVADLTLLPASASNEQPSLAVGASPSRPCRPASRISPGAAAGGAGTPMQRAEAPSPAASPPPPPAPHLPPPPPAAVLAAAARHRGEEWASATPRDGLALRRPQRVRLRTATSMPPTLARDGQLEAGLPHEFPPCARSR